MFDYLSNLWSGAGDWFSNYFGNASAPTQYKSYDPFTIDSTLDLTSNTGGLNSLDTYNLGSQFGGNTDWLSRLASNYSFLPSSAGGSSSLAGNTGSSISNTMKGAGSSLTPLVATLGAGALTQGVSDIFENKKAKKSNEEQKKAAASYRGALQKGKEEATSQYLQNMSAQEAALKNKLGAVTADRGGANPRKMMEKLKRTQNEGFGNFQLDLAQQKTPELAAFTTGAGSVPSSGSAFLGGMTKGAAGTLGNVGSIYLTQLLKNLLIG
jgi:hypothetical protein